MFKVGDPTTEEEDDCLGKIREEMEDFAARCRKMTLGGKDCAVDEITVHMDAPKANLKRNCHHYKAAGDGMQADALCQKHGYIKDFIWRGDPKVPLSYTLSGDTDGVKNRVNMLLSRSLKDDYHELYFDNLYGHVEWMDELVRGQELLVSKFHVRKGRKPDMPGGESTMVIKKVRCCGTMRTNSGIQKSGLDVQKPKNLSSDLEKVSERKREKATDRAKLKQIKLGDGEKFILAVMPDAGLLKIASTIHTEVYDCEMMRKKWNKDEQQKEDDLMWRLNIQEDYNFSMCFVDVADLLSWQYRIGGGYWRNLKWWHAPYKWKYDTRRQLIRAMSSTS